MGKKNSFFKKQSGRVVENKGKWQKTNRKQTGNKATEVVENNRGAKKQSENKPKNEAGHIVENKGSAKNKPETDRKGQMMFPKAIVIG